MDLGQEELKPQLPTESNPVAFFDAFRQSNFYKKAEGEFFAGKTLSPQVTDAMKRKAFEQNQEARLALVDFAFKEKKLGYDPTQYPPEIQPLFDTYYEKAKEERRLKNNPEGQEAYGEADRERRYAHMNFSEALANSGIVKKDKMAEILARLLLLTKGIGDYESTRDGALNNPQGTF